MPDNQRDTQRRSVALVREDLVQRLKQRPPLPGYDGDISAAVAMLPDESDALGRYADYAVEVLSGAPVDRELEQVFEALVLAEAAEKAGQVLPGNWAPVRALAEQWDEKERQKWGEILDAAFGQTDSGGTEGSS